MMAHQKVNGNAESITLLLYTIASILRQRDVKDQRIPSSRFHEMIQLCRSTDGSRTPQKSLLAHQHHHPAPNSAPARNGEIWRSCWFNLTQSTSPYMNH